MNNINPIKTPAVVLRKIKQSLRPAGHPQCCLCQMQYEEGTPKEQIFLCLENGFVIPINQIMMTPIKF